VRNKLTLVLDADDTRDVWAAIRLREDMPGGVPDGDSNREGALLAEICRGWMEMLDAGATETASR
jgi:hypothetical protein